MPLRVGDRVKVMDCNQSCNPAVLHMIGTIIKIGGVDMLPINILVEFDTSFVKGHNGDGLGRPRRCWWLAREEVFKIEKPAKVYTKESKCEDITDFMAKLNYING